MQLGGLNKSLIGNELGRGVIFALTTAGGLLAKHGAQTKTHDTLKAWAKVITTRVWHTESLTVACRLDT